MPVDHSFEGKLRNTERRLTEIERRLGRSAATPFELPARLSGTGQKVTSWGEATEPGFYNGVSAVGQPAKGWDYNHDTAFNTWVGLVVRASGATGAIKQFVTRPGEGTGWEFVRVATSNGVSYSWGPWSNIGFTETWTDLKPYLATGISFQQDTATSGTPGICARRKGKWVEIMLGNFVVDTLSIPTNGNITNRLILSAIPNSFRPVDGVVSTVTGWAGRTWSGYLNSSGNLYIGAVQPNVDWTGTVFINNEILSGTCSFMKP